MSFFMEGTIESPKGRITLGDAFDEAAGPIDKGKAPEIQDKDWLAAARRHNQSLRKAYQARVRVSDRGSPVCFSCIREFERKAQNLRIAEPLKEPQKEEDEAKPYKYDTLPDTKSSIRILELQPATSYDAPLRADLVTCPTRADANYVALSYTWQGVPTEGDLDLGTGIMAITGNLDLALRALRPKDTVLRIWVDAVCINQQDYSEKGDQVSQMDKVYKEANSIIAWLGPASEHSQGALEYMKDLAELSEALGFDKYIQSPPLPNEPGIFPMDEDVALDISEMQASKHLVDIIERAWFTRLWVVQEILLAKDLVLHVGNDSIVWEDFRTVVKILWTASCQYVVPSSEQAKPDPIVPALKLVSKRDSLQTFNKGRMMYRDYTTQIHGMVRDLSTWGCKDERDRVYGILGFIPDDSDIALAPDYYKSASEVYIEFARQHILHEGLAILLFAGLEQRPGDGSVELFKKLAIVPAEQTDSIFDRPDFLEEPELPSWVPELRPDRNHVPKRLWLPLTFNTALNRTPAVVMHKECPHVLAVKGCIFDEIMQPLPPDGTRPGNPRLLDYHHLLVYIGTMWVSTKSYYEDRGGYPTGESHKTAFDSVVTADRTTGKLARAAEDREPGWIDKMLEAVQRGADGGVSGFEEAIAAASIRADEFSLFVACLSSLFQYDQLIITEEGYLGLAPNCVQAGDKIAWINELMSPVILRPHPSKIQHYLIGPCFLHGVMHGELDERDASVEEWIELI